ncbi:iron permease [Lentinus tigrinus ALCF2SS1-6]|uniref:Iron permease n=1 Tax=Lentinus tigrinus ALCF2SS1-6 TaxID=1328759 RepID=A0A5C2RWP5_9APHY|nr:iron permease [Lentinus tigrinus ALCF2SS1-6]
MSQDTLASRTNTSLSTLGDVKKTSSRKGLAFWMAFIAVLASLFLSVLDLCAVPTALPTIVADLQGGDQYIWVGSAYALSSTAVLLLCGRMADIFGRRPVMLTSITIFALGSALAGASQSMSMLVAARVVQGLGGGCIYAMTQIITSDLVPLAERAAYQSALVMVYALAAGIGPFIGAVFSEKASWRWLFYLNLPLTGLAFALVAIFLRVNTPGGAVLTKLSRMDWIGNGLIAAGSSLTLIGLVWGGVHYPWNSAHVLGPLISGVVLMAAFFFYEYMLFGRSTSEGKTGNNTSSATLPFVATFLHGFVSIAIIYYMPVFFQACMGASAIRSSVDTLPISVVMTPFAMFCGITIKVTQKYRPMNYLGWTLSAVGVGLLTLLRPDSSTAKWAGFQFIAAAGTGINYASTLFPILAPLPVARNAAAVAFFAFCRSFAQTWGIAMAGVILQNRLSSTLPAAFVSLFPGDVDLAFAAVPVIRTLDESLRAEVQLAFADSLSIVWKVMIGVCGAGFLTVLLLKEVPMTTHMDERFALEKGEKIADEEKGQVATA